MTPITYRKLSIEDVVDTLKRAGLKFHVAGVSPVDTTLAQVKLEPILHQGKQVGDEATSARKALERAGAVLCWFSVKERTCEFRIVERVR